MKISNIIQAINLCVSKRIPFVAYQMPNENNITFFSNPTLTPNNKKFSIGFFGDKINNPITIHNEFNAIETIEYINKYAVDQQHMPLIYPYNITTAFSAYKQSFINVTDYLKKGITKIVLSKVICGNHNITDWSSVVLKYFNKFNSTFRYIYYTHNTGCWIGASPEVIIVKENSNNNFSTMSLAGTRKINDKFQQWDNKNMSEHDIVTKYIVSTLREEGCVLDVSNYTSIPFGDIEHLCNHITFKCPNEISPINLVKVLSPTPALSGYPINDSLKILEKIEAHPRYCYGGYVAVSDIDNFYSYVNLRCAHFDNKTFCIYSGGGITLESLVEEEWQETENKIVELKNIFI